MFPSELEITQRRKDLQRDAEHYRLVQFARERRPSVWQQLRSRLSAARPQTVAQDRESFARRDVVAMSR